jgi:predicted RNase H-like nuclease
MPYSLLAGVLPLRGGWLVASGKLVGITLYPEIPSTFTRLQEIIDHIPEYSIVALAAPVGLPDEPQKGGRTCDRLARQTLGWPRRGAIVPVPCREAMAACDYVSASLANGGRLDFITWGLRERIREVAAEIQPYLQRNVFEVNSELSFYQLNDDRPMVYPKRSLLGQAERRELLMSRMQNVERILDGKVPGVRPWQLADACAALWTARRIVARAVTRLPLDPEWNSDGLRMEIVR